jgi:hypothetical protein
MLQPLYSCRRSTNRRLGGSRAHLDIFGMRKNYYPCKRVEPLIIKATEFDMRDISTYYKKCKVDTIQLCFNLLKPSGFFTYHLV